MTYRKRQWGTETDTTPLPYIHNRPSSNTIALSRLAIVLTILFWVIYIVSVIIRQLFEGPQSYQFTMEVIGYVVVVSFLTFSALMYLITRQGALQRFSKHVRVPRAVLDKHFSKQKPSLTVLIPSYSEEPHIIRKTIISAALQEYPNMKIVLLVDDNPNPIDSALKAKLKEIRNLKKNIMDMFSEPYKKLTQANKAFEMKKMVSRKDIIVLAEHYEWAAGWLRNMATREQIEDHVDIFFTEQIIEHLAQDLSLVSKAIYASNQEGVLLSKKRVQELYRRLVWIFKTNVEVFERKQYASLSQEPNKAMNLNSYIGLMGGYFKKEKTPDGTVLLPTSKTKADVSVPDSEFILTLDADSMLLKDYCLRLVYFLQQPDNERVAVTQTPYSSYRGASTRIERISGATTDIQHILHQGMSYYGATFWVGANAVIRKKALEDIAESEWIGGFEVKRYIHDNTVIEDTESSIDLVRHGWKLVNYPERLSYSATPPDFGSLVVQRRRWANGGLLILPKHWNQIAEYGRKRLHVSKAEIMIRLNYMASIAWSNLGLVFLLAYPYDGRLLSPLILLAALPYFIAMAADLRYCRYKYTDIIRIYGFNLILLPVNIAGVAKSLQQALTTKKIPFARTPKVKDRTVAELPYVIAPLLIVAFSLFTLWRNIEGQNWGNAAFAGFNAIAATWAIIAYIGIKNIFVDIWIGILNWLYVENGSKQGSNTDIENKKINWQSILYHGEESNDVPHHSINTIIFEKNTR